MPISDISENYGKPVSLHAEGDALHTVQFGDVELLATQTCVVNDSDCAQVGANADIFLALVEINRLVVIE